MKILSKIRARYLSVVVLLFTVILSIQVLARKSAPDLTDVLRGQKFSFDFGYFLMGFFALSLATLSFAKGYEIFTRPKKEEKNSELDILKEENCRFFEMNTGIQKENEDLKRQILRLEEAFRSKSGQEEILQKTSAGLKKECEKLQAEKSKLSAEKEALALELNQKSIFELPKMPPPEINKPKVMIRLDETVTLKKTIKVKKKAHSTHKKKGGKK